MCGNALIVAEQYAGDFGLAKTAGPVESPNCCDILFQQDLAVTAMAEHPSSGLLLHSRPKQLVRKEPIAGDANGGQFVAITGIDGVDDLHNFAVERAVLIHTDGDIKVTESLQMILDVAPAFV